MCNKEVFIVLETIDGVSNAGFGYYSDIEQARADMKKCFTDKGEDFEAWFNCDINSELYKKHNCVICSLPFLG